MRSVLIAEIFYLYKETFILLLIASILLPAVGIHLIARKRILETYALTQGTVLGHLLGQLLVYFFGSYFILTFPYAWGALSLIVTYFFLRVFSPAFSHQLSSFYFAVAIAFMAFGFGLSSFFPFLESTVSRAYMGDIVTASLSEIFWGTFFLTVAALVYIRFFYQWRRETLNQALFGVSISQKISRSNLFFNIIVLITLTIGIISLGHLYTLACMTILPVLLNTLKAPFKIYLTLCLCLSFSASFLGLSSSLIWPRVSTVPVIILYLVLFGVFANLYVRVHRSLIDKS